MLWEGRIRSFRKRPLTYRAVPLRSLLLRLKTRRHTTLPRIIMLNVLFKTTTTAAILNTHFPHIFFDLLDTLTTLMQIGILRIPTVYPIRGRTLKLATFRKASIIGIGYLALGFRYPTTTSSEILIRLLMLRILMSVVVLIG